MNKSFLSERHRTRRVFGRLWWQDAGFHVTSPCQRGNARNEPAKMTRTEAVPGWWAAAKGSGVMSWSWVMGNHLLLQICFHMSPAELMGEQWFCKAQDHSERLLLTFFFFKKFIYVAQVRPEVWKGACALLLVLWLHVCDIKTQTTCTEHRVVEE